MYNSEVTILLVTYHTDLEKITSLLQEKINDFRVLIVDNSSDKDLKTKIEKKFSNTEVVLSKSNTGQVGGINLGLSLINTKYCLYMDIDVNFDKKIIFRLLQYAKKIKNFIILCPPHHKREYQTDFFLSRRNKKIDKMKIAHGHFFFFNISKVKTVGLYDERIFIYYDETEYCLRCNKLNENIYLIRDIKVSHEDGKSTNETINTKIMHIRHWHLMWGKVYVNKKYYGFLYTFWIIIPDLIEGITKMLFYLLLNKHKSRIYKYRLLGLLESLINRPSWRRPDKLIN
jgi:GT2 family glycosyltransferase